MVLSLRLYKLNSDAVNPRLNEILNAEMTQIKPTYRKNSLFFKEKPNYRRSNSILSQPFLGKSTLVSRIIPHGYNAGSYEYDSRLNTLYKPLIRFHVKKPIEDQERDIVRVITEKPKVLGYLIGVKRPTNKQRKTNLSSKLRKILKKNKNNDLGKYLRTITHDELISKLLDKSQEDFEDMRPGSLGHHTTEKPGHVVVIPQYPFWNYWTVSYVK